MNPAISPLFRISRIIRCRAALVVALTAVLTSCTTLKQSLIPQPLNISTENLPLKAEITSLPHFPQTTHHCGPASLAALLAHRGRAVSAEQLAPHLYIPARQGSLQIELIAQTRLYQLIAYQLTPSIQSVLREVSAGNPVLVLQNLGFTWWPNWHYAVVRGYDLSKNRITLSSGDQPHYSIPLALFLNTWQRGNNWAVVVMPSEKLPETAEPEAYLRSVNQLEQVGQLEAAHTGYQTALHQWPENTTALLGVGNTAYHLGQYTMALAAFQQLPQQSSSWNNIAFTLLKLGCQAQASKAVQCAVQLSPGDTFYLRSQQELETQVFSGKNTFSPALSGFQCPKIECQPNQ